MIKEFFPEDVVVHKLLGIGTVLELGTSMNSKIWVEFDKFGGRLIETKHLEHYDKEYVEKHREKDILE